MLPLVAALLIAAVFLLFLGRRRRVASGLPGGRVIYTDTTAWGKVEKPLYDPALDLTGKPDYLVKEGSQIIPVEVKSGRTPNAPYDAHIFQLAAYCMLVQRVLGTRPKYGIIRYPARTFAVDYTRQLEEALIDVIADIRSFQRKREVGRSHDSAARCRGCGYRQTCEESLA